ncbi:MAG TPA: M20/M25/M40 family metallo-hydrolase [Rhodanobacteraceae bacterium]
MSALLDRTLAHLAALVAFDTRNPPRTIGTGGIFDYVRQHLPGFAITVTDHGGGSVSLYAVRGAPRLLFNVHLDTVPDSPRWSADPFALRVAGGHAVALGACDIKGAAAGLLAAAETDGSLALLFTTDEEGAKPRCVKAFLDSLPLPSGERRGGAPDGGSPTHGDAAGTESSPRSLSRREIGFKAVIVAEPTCGEAVLAHRGIQSVRVQFRGRAGHASAPQRPGDSALHQAVRWGNAALDYADAQATQAFGELTGMRFNLGRIEGGIKPNMIAPEAEVRFGMRPLPSTDMDALLQRLRGLASHAPAAFEETFRGAPLPADSATATQRLQVAHALADELGIAVGAAVDFWTEAALFSGAGYPALVFGPGDIAQAHSADEWVALAQLQAYAETVQRLVGEGKA